MAATAEGKGVELAVKANMPNIGQQHTGNGNIPYNT